MPSNPCARADRVRASMYLNIHLSAAQDQAGKSAGHRRVSPSLTTQCRESSASPPVTRYSVFFWLLIFHASPLTVSWWSLSLYMVKAWLRSACSTARNYYFQCKSPSRRARRAAACKICMCLFKYAPRCTMVAKKKRLFCFYFLIFFYKASMCNTGNVGFFF